MKRNKHELKLFLFGSLAFLCVVAVYRRVLPMWGSDAPLARLARTEAATRDLDRAAEESTEKPNRRVAQAASVAEEDGEAAPEELLARYLSLGSGWHTMDLTKWEYIDLCRRCIELGKDSVLNLDVADAPRLAEKLHRARSIRMRQFLLVTLATLEYGAAEEYARYLTVEGLEGASAYALGRRGGEAGMQLVREALGKPKLSSSRRDALYYGLGQGGPPALSSLLRATRTRLRQGADPSDDLPLSFLRWESSSAELVDLALMGEEPGVRVSALRAFSRRDAASAVDHGWVHQLATDPGTDSPVRVEALRALLGVDEASGERLAGEILGSIDADDDLVLGALHATIACGIPEGYLGRVDQLVRGDDPDLRLAALNALVADRSEESTQLLRELLPALPPDDRQAVLVQLASTPPGPPSDARDALHDDLVAWIEAGLFAEGVDQLALQVLAFGGEPSDLAADLAWGRFLETGWEDRTGNRALLELAQVVGPEANPEIIDAYRETGEFLSRVELASCLADIDGNMDDPEVAAFLSGEVLDDLRTRLVDQTGAMLAYVGTARSQQNSLAMTIGNVFGRYGTRDDIALLEQLGDLFLAQGHPWPDSLRDVIHQSLVEAAGRGADLIDMREVAQ